MLLKNNHRYLLSLKISLIACILLVSACGGNSGFTAYTQTVVSESYRVTYIPSEMAVTEGKSNFSFKVSDHQGYAVTGLQATFKPLMVMSTHQHATPFTEIVEDTEEPGLYHGTLFFLMASTMANGNSMGDWEVGIDLGGESVTFYPTVTMSMGDTVRANLKSQLDCNSGMMNMAEKCSYLLFQNGLESTATGYRFSLFIAAKQNMMTFPALAVGLDIDAANLQVSSIKVELSTDELTWTIADSEGAGFWSTDELNDLIEDEETTIYVRLTVNGQQATDDGNSPDGTADNAIFSLTPSSSMTL